MDKVLSKTGIANKDQWWYEYLNSKPPRVGYAGIMTLGNKTLTPISISKGIPGLVDTEGRVITTEFPQFFLVNVYQPFSGLGLERL